MNVSSSHPSTAVLRQQVLGKQTKRSRKNLPSTTTLSTYVGIFLLIVTLVAIGYQPPQRVENVASIAGAASTAASTSTSAPSVDEVVATSLAGDIAQRANLPIVSNVAELSVSLAVKSELAQNDDSTITKPQIVETASASRDIKIYTTQAGDTAQTVAAKHGISATTLKWANSLESDALDAGKKLKILPTDGVVYTVRSGDTTASLAKRYSVNEDRIVTYNDLELDGLTAGKQIILPAANLPASERPGYVAPTPSYGTSSGSTVTGVAANFNASAGNRYAYGWCTWYAYERRAQMGRPIGSFWGNASSWAYSARSAGLTVNNTPAAGAIFQTGGGYSGMGHVGIIESVDWSKGTVTYSDMNGLAGFGRVGRDTISLSDAKARWTFIH